MESSQGALVGELLRVAGACLSPCPELGTIQGDLCQGISGAERSKGTLCTERWWQCCCVPGFVWRGGGSAWPDNCKHALKEYCFTQLIKECAAVCAATNSNQFYLFVGSRFVSRPVSKTQNLG